MKLIAYYLPQFHPIPENDAWWGRGFTEWTNVAKAAPVYAGHYQPKLPGELGFYDLRVVDVMRRQIELARLYGISAFCLHFYWFGGKRLLEGPLLSLLEHSDLDIQFCLCWANENWTRRWNGADQEVLIGQAHSPEDDVAMIRYLKKYFDDRRYLKIEGKPVLTVYRPGILPDAAATIARWRAEAAKMGFPGLYLVATNSFGFSDAKSIGFDALSEFPPHGAEKCAMDPRKVFPGTKFKGRIRSYANLMECYATEATDALAIWPGVAPAWDNTARVPTRSQIFHGSAPELFHKWLSKAIVRARQNPPSQRHVIINAWNEWAEGAYLEPDRRFGYAYLNACGSAISHHLTAEEMVTELLAETRKRFQAQSSLACVLHLYYPDMAEEFARSIKAFGEVDVYITVPNDLSYDVAKRITEVFPKAFILEIENRGRDMLPFLTVFRAVQRANYRFVCKLHTKRSPHLPDGDQWRRQLVESLLSPAAHESLNEAEQNQKIGIIVSKGSLCSLKDKYVRHHSVERMNRMAKRTGITLTFKESFVAGSMFWFRPEALSIFSNLASVEDFETELGQTDGTVAHALERMTIIAVKATGFEVAEIDGPTKLAQRYDQKRIRASNCQKTVFLHIGLHRTGTSSIQYAFSAAREALTERAGVLYPRAACPEIAPKGHHSLPWSLTRPDLIKSGDASLDDWRVLREEIDSSKATRILLSSEEFDTLSGSLIEEVGHLLKGYHIVPIIYFRDPVEWFDSYYRLIVDRCDYAQSFEYFLDNCPSRSDFRRMSYGLGKNCNEGQCASV